MALTDDDKKSITRIIKDGDAKALVDYANMLGKRWGQEYRQYRNNETSKTRDERLSTSQIRNIFNSIKKIEMYGFEKKINDFILLKPKLRYVAGRPGKTIAVEEMRDTLEYAIDCVGDDKTKFENFCNFFEAILAYHRAAGGK